MSDLRVPKRRTPVEIAVPGGLVRQFDLFLAEFASDHVGPERVSDLVNGALDFVPAFSKDENAMIFLHRQNIVFARVAAEVESEEGEQHTLPTEQSVEVILLGGVRLLGMFSYVRPPESSRLVDYLNEAPLFLRLLEKSHVALINKHQIAQVRNVG